MKFTKKGYVFYFFFGGTTILNSGNLIGQPYVELHHSMFHNSDTVTTPKKMKCSIIYKMYIFLNKIHGKKVHMKVISIKAQSYLVKRHSIHGT